MKLHQVLENAANFVEFYHGIQTFNAFATNSQQTKYEK